MVVVFNAPYSIHHGVHDDFLLIVEAEVDMENNVFSAEKVYREVLMVAVSDMASDVDLRASVKVFTDGVGVGDLLEKIRDFSDDIGNLQVCW